MSSSHSPTRKALSSVIAAGCSIYGKRIGQSSKDLLNESLDELFSSCPKLAVEDIDAFYLGQAFPESFEHQANPSPGCAIGYGMNRIPSVRVDTVSSSGGSSLRQGILGIMSGEFNVVICAGVEKMSGASTEQAVEVISMASDRPFEQWNGATLASLNALSAREHMRRYGTAEEDMALVSVKNHENAYENPKAYLHKRVSVEDVLSSRKISTPLKLLDCSPICDGASCVALSRPELAEQLCENPIDIVGSAESSDLDFVFREEITSFRSTREAAHEAYSRSELKPTDIDFFELHDAFTINEIIAYEDIGLCKAGEGGKLARSGKTRVDGDFPVNPSGGLKAKGHPVGSSGIGQAYEVFMQLSGKVKTPSRAVRGAKRALTHSMGGAGVTAQVHIFSARF